MFCHSIRGLIACYDASSRRVVYRLSTSTQYDVLMYRHFPDDLLATVLYWTLMQSACAAFAGKPQLVAAYLQILRYVIEHHIQSYGTSCYCWIRELANSMSRLHDPLALCGDFEWRSVVASVVMPLARCISRIRQAQTKPNCVPTCSKSYKLLNWRAALPQGATHVRTWFPKIRSSLAVVHLCTRILTYWFQQRSAILQL